MRKGFGLIGVLQYLLVLYCNLAFLESRTKRVVPATGMPAGEHKAISVMSHRERIPRAVLIRRTSYNEKE